MRNLALTTVFLALTISITAHSAELMKRFGYGMNYAWRNYAGDFGGIDTWGKRGVSEQPAEYLSELKEMADHGVEVVRWWVWPEFWTDSIRFSEDGTAEVIDQQAIQDGLKALELADQAGVRLMLCLFSFDGFRPTRERYGITMSGYHDTVIDHNRRTALMENVVRPFVRALGASPYRKSLHSWDVINEPEWAVHGNNRHGGQPFVPDSELQTITHQQMEGFIADTIDVLRRETPDVPITVGSAAIHWVDAWAEMDTDFYQANFSNWASEDWPYTLSPADFGVEDKPLVIGGYPVEGLDNADHTTLLNSWYSSGYAGALGWDFRLTHSPGVSKKLIDVKRAGYLREYESFVLSAVNGLITVPDAAVMQKKPGRIDTATN